MVEPASGPDPCEVGDDAAEHASRIRLQRATVRETLHATATPREGAGDGASETSEAAKRPMATAADATSTEVVETTKKKASTGKVEKQAQPSATALNTKKQKKNNQKRCKQQLGHYR